MRGEKKSINHNSLINAFNNAELSGKCGVGGERTGRWKTVTTMKLQSIISIELSPTFNFSTCEKSENMHFNAFSLGWLQMLKPYKCTRLNETKTKKQNKTRMSLTVQLHYTWLHHMVQILHCKGKKCWNLQRKLKQTKIRTQIIVWIEKPAVNAASLAVDFLPQPFGPTSNTWPLR